MLLKKKQLIKIKLRRETLMKMKNIGMIVNNKESFQSSSNIKVEKGCHKDGPALRKWGI